MTIKEFVDGMFQDGSCPFCGCSQGQHDRRLRRTDTGNKVYIHCLNCPTKMQTRNVVCVAEPGVYR